MKFKTKSFLDYFTPIAEFFKPVFSLISEFVTDTDLKAKLENALAVKCAELEMTFKMRILELQSRVIDAEIAMGTHWRAVCIYVCGSILGLMLINNYILFPYLVGNWIHATELPIPQELWWTFWGLTGLSVIDMLQRRKQTTGKEGETNV